eukprot:TRINITY_DN21555_c0_g1_i1.p1 TRINITY_DN21555_c0_g1~~TRINITY_DN21555_c0_g1_i1.p1  ORF type:complete len:456 (+),score=65.30 TRINITY_DN21555_c0_g1_i1:62-1369(+)
MAFGRLFMSTFLLCVLAAEGKDVLWSGAAPPVGSGSFSSDATETGAAAAAATGSGSAAAAADVFSSEAPSDGVSKPAGHDDADHAGTGFASDSPATDWDGSISTTDTASSATTKGDIFQEAAADAPVKKSAGASAGSNGVPLVSADAQGHGGNREASSATGGNHHATDSAGLGSGSHGPGESSDISASDDGATNIGGMNYNGDSSNHGDSISGSSGSSESSGMPATDAAHAATADTAETTSAPATVTSEASVEAVQTSLEPLSTTSASSTTKMRGLRCTCADGVQGDTKLNSRGLCFRDKVACGGKCICNDKTTAGLGINGICYQDQHKCGPRHFLGGNCLCLDGSRGKMTSSGCLALSGRVCAKEGFRAGADDAEDEGEAFSIPIWAAVLGGVTALGAGGAIAAVTGVLPGFAGAGAPGSTRELFGTADSSGAE